MIPHEVLARMAGTLRGEIGPAVEDPFAKTQAFMASVVLTKLAGQLRTAAADARAADDERRIVVAELRRQLGPTTPADVTDAVDDLGRHGDDRTWSRLVEAIYAAGADDLLAVVRPALRARLDRALASSA
jgi:hypothetical protein